MFKIPIIPSDLRHEETIIQAAYALDCLQNTIVHIFERIDKRIEKNYVKVEELQKRISNSQSKINSLRGTRKAIRIYAPSKFPASKSFKDLPVTFDELKQSAQKPVGKYQVESKIETNLPDINEKLIFFHVRNQNNKLTPDSALARERYNIKQNQDLGNMPSDLRSVPSLLLFNSDCSAYNLRDCEKPRLGYADAGKRARSLRNKRQDENCQSITGKQILVAAPHSMVHRTRNEKLTPSGGLKYTPKLTEAPELDLPLDLPDLPGIADDLRYESTEAKQKIAPSLAFEVDNLPELTDLIKADSKSDQHSIEDAQNESTSTPPPPPPPPVMLSAVPPPPPPPPILEHKVTQVGTNANSTDTRSELMAAIRNAGGVGKAHLRSTAAAPVAGNDNDVVDNMRTRNISAKKITSESGDLMADLHNKLLMRRKGISGSKDVNKNEDSIIKKVDNVAISNKPSGNPIISRLSSLIPPPPELKYPTRGSIANTSEDDDDSNDTDWVD